MSKLCKLVDYSPVQEFLEFEFKDWSQEQCQFLLSCLVEKMPAVMLNPDRTTCDVKAFKPVVSRMILPTEPKNNGMYECQINSAIGTNTEGVLCLYLEPADLTSCADEE